MPLFPTLQSLGLSSSEAQVYLALLELGSSFAGPVIKKTGLHRGTTYQILQRLMEKGLVSSVVKGKKQHFHAAEPERLMDVLKEKEAKLQEILPQLHVIGEANREKQDVTVYQGLKGIRSALDRLIEDLKHGGEYYDFGVSGLYEEMMTGYWDRWQKQKHDIKSFIIVNEELRQKNPEFFKKYLGEVRFHPKEYTSLTDTFIYHDVVLMIIWTASPLLAIVIRNQANANSYKNQF